MSTALLNIGLSCALLLVTAAGGPAAWAQDDQSTRDNQVAANAPAEPVRERPGISQGQYRKAITDVESTQGAYAPQLTESLFSLGMALQQSGDHQSAVKAFKRGVHLARINDGLYSAQQIPMLQREVASHMALGQYAEADERQLYLYRVQMRSMEGGLSRAQAFMQQAQWQYNAYRLALDGQGYARLMSMWDLYRLALNDIVDRQGETSLLLMEPLEGMLLSQYLIANYDVEDINGGAENFSLQQQLNRFNAYRAQSYQKGQAIIQAIYDVRAANHGVNSKETVNARVMLGDWVLWFGQRETAMNAYEQALAELVARGDAEIEIDAIFGAPVELPNLDGVRRLPPTASPERANLLLQFGVNQQGKVYDLERLDENELNKAQTNNLMRTLRRTQFRPRLAMGEPQDTEKVTRAYEIEQQ